MIMNQHRPPRGAKRWPWLVLPVILLSAMIWLLVPVSGEQMSQLNQVLPLVAVEDQQPPPPPPPPPPPATAQEKKDLPPPPPPPPPRPTRKVTSYVLKRVPGGVPSGKGKKAGNEVVVTESKGVPGGVPSGVPGGVPGPPSSRSAKGIKGTAKRGEYVLEEVGPGDNPRPPIKKSVKSRIGSDQLPPPPPPPPKPTPSSTPKEIKVKPKVIKDSGNPPPSAPRVIRNDDSPLSVRVERPSARTVRVSLVRDADKLPLPQSSV